MSNTAIKRLVRVRDQFSPAERQIPAQNSKGQLKKTTAVLQNGRKNIERSWKSSNRLKIVVSRYKILHSKNIFILSSWKGRELTISRKIAKFFYVGRKSHHLTDPSFKRKQMKIPDFFFNTTSCIKQKKKKWRPACVAACNSCEATLIWQPESTPPGHHQFHTCRNVWLLCPLGCTSEATFFFFPTTFCRNMWSIPKQRHGNVEFIC